ncbi:hypothetical protein EKG37_20955 [Robertmurraya yapensis]|uniref:Uncharacterized protein n=2 Tax=Bacillaceae TaxID=186817 RepID=A0A3S0KAS2_9BACI|nr:MULTISPECIES: hypothetical protein [Bacillaceae]RTR26544.1 hypothetical protein EKG37_20955 [Bacillus yapensis]TKC15093.1 hypothetical protein FA727_19565 [Robertmurraya kyonggiensis]TKS93719.1 hypothetical protein FAR12_20960 [Bacillus yapensis]
MISLQNDNANSSGFREEFSNKLVNKLTQHPDISAVELVSNYAYAMQMKYHSYLITITPAKDTVFIQEQALYSKWTDELNNILKDTRLPLIESFAKAKYALDQMFLLITERGKLEYIYHRKALITSHQLQKLLGISKATLSRYVSTGMERITDVGHRCYPLHNFFYWQNGVWASRIQALYQHYRIRNRIKEDVIKELMDEISEFQNIYNGTFEEVFENIDDPYSLDEPDDYFDWRDALEELNKLQYE